MNFKFERSESIEPKMVASLSVAGANRVQLRMRLACDALHVVANSVPVFAWGFEHDREYSG